MSTLSKVFVVFNFLIAIAFMIASLTLYAKKINWVENSTQSAEQRRIETAERKRIETEYEQYKLTTTNKITDNDRVIKNQATKITELEQTVSSEQQKNARLQGAVEDINGSIADVEARLQEQSDDNKRLTAENKKLRTERDEAVLAREFAESTAIEAISDLKEAEQELLQISKRNHQLVELNMEQAIIIDEARKRGFDPTTIVASATSVNPITAQVLEVEEAVGIVILNVGEKKNVKPGMEFVISRGSQYVGKVRVRNIYEDMCSAIMIPELMKAPVEVSDLAQTM